MAEETETTTGTETTATETTPAVEATPATETTGAETKEAEVKTEEKEAEVKTEEKAPEPIDYAKALSEVPLPEGVTLDPEAAKAGTELFGKHNLSAEAVKDLVSLYARQQKAGADGNARAFATQVQGWKEAAEKATTPEERGTAREAALKVFGKDELALLETFGITNRSGFIKAFATLGKAIKDDPFVPGNAGGVGSRSATAYFPNTPGMNP